MIIPEDEDLYPSICFKDYNPENRRYGICKTKGNHYHHFFRKPTESGKTYHWGYCSKECFLGKFSSFSCRLLHIPKLYCNDM